MAKVGGVLQTRKRQGQEGSIFAPVEAERQARAVEYLNRQVFATPEWMLQPDLLNRFMGSGVPDMVRGRQVFALNGLLSVDRMKRLVEQEAFLGGAAYGLGEMLDDLRRGVWSEAYAGRATDAYRRNLQRAWLDRIAELMEDEDALASDVAPFVRGELTAVREVLAAASPADRATRLHYQDAVARIDPILDPD